MPAPFRPRRLAERTVPTRPYHISALQPWISSGEGDVSLLLEEMAEQAMVERWRERWRITLQAALAGAGLLHLQSLPAAREFVLGGGQGEGGGQQQQQHCDGERRVQTAGPNAAPAAAAEGEASDAVLTAATESVVAQLRAVVEQQKEQVKALADRWGCRLAAAGCTSRVTSRHHSTPRLAADGILWDYALASGHVRQFFRGECELEDVAAHARVLASWRESSLSPPPAMPPPVPPPPPDELDQDPEGPWLEQLVGLGKLPWDEEETEEEEEEEENFD